MSPSCTVKFVWKDLREINCNFIKSDGNLAKAFHRFLIDIENFLSLWIFYFDKSDNGNSTLKSQFKKIIM